MRIYYNENDPFAAAWLRELIYFGAIPAGDVDDRSITDVEGWELAGYDQCHFFAGIGGWAYALELAQWHESAWTGSCPCQPFSVAGKGLGEADERHLWPEFKRLIADCAPPVVFGEQVASKAGRVWLAGVRADLEALGYAVGAADLCAAGVSAPHIRQRLYWVADAQRNAREPWRASAECSSTPAPRTGAHVEPGRRGDTGGLAGDDEAGRSECPQSHGAEVGGQQTPRRRDAMRRSGLGDDDDAGPQRRHEHAGERRDQRTPWSAGVFIPCADGKARRVEPGIFPLAHGFPNRVGILRGAGNAIVPQVAQEFIEAFKETKQ